jgi:uncharacterized protein (TIGR04551 family)
MSRRLPAALAAFLALSAGARAAQDEKKQDEVDAKTRAAIERAVEKAKDDIRNEVRAEMQGAQSAAEFLGAVAEGPKLEFFEVDGYYRFRGQLLGGLDLRAGRDASNRYLFPISRAGQGGSSLATANMRLRLEPTLNVSEHVRVRAQVDVFDNHVLGSSTSALFDDPNSPYPVPFYGSSRVLGVADPRLDRPYVSPKRAWAEIQTPVGLLSFGRMPSHWGLGVMANSGAGIDEDFGDTVDRIQFALPSVSTPIGRLTLVPILDFDNEGTLYADPRYADARTGVGQPFDAAKGDDARSLSIKVARLDTEDEVRRKNERNEASVNYGVYYSYKTQRYFYPEAAEGFDPQISSSTEGAAGSIHRAAYAHVVDFWWRLLTTRWRIEAEVTGIYGSIGDARNTLDPLVPVPPKLLLRQWGGALVIDYKVSPNRFMLGGEVGAASGDAAPGFGNIPSRGQTPYGSLEGAQWGRGGDRSIRNFRFNPAYRVDLILFHQILGQVTDAVYVKPKLRWDLLPGLFFDAQVVYSRALEASSTPSARADGTGGSANLGIEVDGMLTYAAGDGFQAWAQYGILEPMGGLAPEDRSLKRAQAMAVGLAAKF